jgi:hypothetical protein
MAKKSGMTKHDLEIGEFLRLGGMKIPAGLAAKARATMTKSMLLKKPEAGTDLRMEGAKLYGQLKGGSSIAVDDPANRETLDRILRLHRRVASKKVAFPKVAPGRGWVSTVFSGTVVPPFGFAYSLPTTPPGGLLPIIGNPTMSGTANVNGQISASAVTSETGTSVGGEFAYVGIYFHPAGPGTLTISATPTYTYEWMTNSIPDVGGLAAGSLWLVVFGVNDQGDYLSPIEDVQGLFSEFTFGQFQYGGQLGAQQSLSASLHTTPSFVYMCYVAADVWVLGEGWPGSLAVSMVSATVPSISYEFAGEFAPPKL